MLDHGLLPVVVALCLPNTALGTFYPKHWYLDDECGRAENFQQSTLLGYSVFHYSSISSNWNCQVTFVRTTPGRGIQVRFRSLKTSYTSDCHVTRLLVVDTRQSLTPPNGVCGSQSPSTVHTTDNTVRVSLITDNSLFLYGDFELLLTEFSEPLSNGSCSGTDFKCNNGICISSSLTCNGYNDCDDDSDEIEGCGIILTVGVIVGIAFGIICFFIFACVVGVLYNRRRRQYVTIVGVNR